MVHLLRLKTADVFTRIDDMHIEIAGKKTILPNSPGGLMEIAKANGYQDSMEIGYYLGGFPLKLNTVVPIFMCMNHVAPPSSRFICYATPT